MPAATQKMPPANSQQNSEYERLLILMQLEEEARKVETVEELRFLIVNETRRLLNYRQAFLFAVPKRGVSKCQLVSATSLAMVDRDAPFVQWIEKTLDTLRPKTSERTPVGLDDRDSDDVALKEGWQEFSLPHVIWCPFFGPNDRFLGGLWLARELPWTEAESALIQRLASAYSHALHALISQKPEIRWLKKSRWVASGLLALSIGAMFIPVNLSVLAPMEVVADEPAIVSSPLNGVISEVMYPPNEPIDKGNVLFKLDDTDLRNSYSLAEKALEVRLAEFRTASQGAFGDFDSKARLALLKEEVELARAELNYRREQLARVEVMSPAKGLLIYSDPKDWIGKPVSIGEGIMEIADPQKIKLRINIPVSDAIILQAGNYVEVFLDSDPLHALKANIIHASYHATELPGNQLAYRVTATLNEEITPRIGLRGTAKVFGAKVPLYFYLFRRPISTVRQSLGL